MKQQKFNIKEYSLFASSILLLHPTLDAEVIYTDIDPDVVLQYDDEVAGIDMDNNGSIDFAFLKNVDSWIYVSSLSIYSATFTLNQIWVGPYYYQNEVACAFQTWSGSTILWPYDLPAGQLIGNSVSFQNYGYLLMAAKLWVMSGSLSELYDEGGAWWPVKEDEYIGVHFTDEDDNYHYGWIRCSVLDSAEVLVIKDYAYETEPDHSIRAGDTISYVGINNMNTAINASIYSFNKSIYIHTDNIHDIQLIICDLTGKQLISKDLQAESEIINMDNYPIGIYLVTLLKDNKRLDKKVMID